MMVLVPDCLCLQQCGPVGENRVLFGPEEDRLPYFSGKKAGKDGAVFQFLPEIFREESFPERQ